MIILDTATLIVYGLLTASILSLWLPPQSARLARIPAWIILLGLSALSGLYYGIVEVGGVLYLFILAAFCRLAGRQGLSSYLRTLYAVLVFGLAAALFLHKAPFFNNPLVFDSFVLSERSSAHTKYWAFDKAAAGLILLACFGDICRSSRDWKMLAHKSYVISIATIALTLLLALIFGYIKPDMKFTGAYFAWAWANLFFTCVPEEMLFRGFLQKRLSGLSEKSSYKIGIVAGIGILFGLAHSGAGATYAVLASVAGIGYGYAYYMTGKIESAILTHFLLNTAHFLFFTYPSVR